MIIGDYYCPKEMFPYIDSAIDILKEFEIRYEKLPNEFRCRLLNYGFNRWSDVFGYHYSSEMTDSFKKNICEPHQTSDIIFPWALMFTGNPTDVKYQHGCVIRNSVGGQLTLFLPKNFFYVPLEEAKDLLRSSIEKHIEKKLGSFENELISRSHKIENELRLLENYK